MKSRAGCGNGIRGVKMLRFDNRGAERSATCTAFIARRSSSNEAQVYSTDQLARVSRLTQEVELSGDRCPTRRGDSDSLFESDDHSRGLKALEQKRAL